MKQTEAQLRAEIVRCGKVLFDKDFAPATSGNISVRLDERLILMTPTGVGKGTMKAEDMVVVDRSGRKIRGGGRPTSEFEMHRAIYDIRADARAVVHAHPPTATGFACAGIALDQPLASEFVMTVGCAPLAPYGTPGTGELPKTLHPLAKEHDALLLANHGVVTLGATLEDAFQKMEVVEHFAKVALVVRQLGRESPLRESDILKLLEGRAKYFGLESAPERRPDCPRPGRRDDAAAFPASGEPESDRLKRIILDVLKDIPPRR